MNIDQTTPLLEKYQRYYEKDSSSRIFAPLAESYRKLGLLQEAFDILNKGIKKHPGYPMGYLVLANCYFDKKNYELAYNTLRPLIPQNRDNIRLQKLFAETCLNTNRNIEALDTFKYLLFINPKNKYIADQVNRLESVQDPVKMESSSETIKNHPPLFNISSIHSSPDGGAGAVSSPEDWMHVDLSNQVECFQPSEQIIVEDSPEDQAFSWQVNDVAKVWKRAIDNQDNKKIRVNLDDSTTNDSDIDFPVITHTLVDLYCEQGHYQKAKMILEKLMILDPDNNKTREKIKEINQFFSLEKVDKKANDGQLSKPQAISHPIISNEGRDNLMSFFDKKLSKKKEINIEIYEKHFSRFLNAIKEKAENFRFATR